MHAISNEARSKLARWRAGELEFSGDIKVEQGNSYWILGDNWICDEGTVVFRVSADDFDVAVTVGDGVGGPDVIEVAYRRRPGGAALGARRVREAGVTTYVDTALRLLVHQVDDRGAHRLGQVAKQVPASLRRAMAGADREPGRRRGRPALTDTELRLLAQAKRNAPRRPYRQAVLGEYRTGSLKAFDMPSESTLGKRIYAARHRIDPATGRPFLGADE